MEQKIIALVSKLAVGLAILFILFTIDEFLPSKGQQMVITKIETELDDYSNRKYHYLHFQNNPKIPINVHIFESLLAGDSIQISITPLFEKLKNFSYLNRVNKKIEYLYEQNGIRPEFVIWNLAGLILAGIALFVKTFEKKCTAFFFAFAMAALHWWNALQ